MNGECGYVYCFFFFNSTDKAKRAISMMTIKGLLPDDDGLAFLFRRIGDPTFVVVPK